MKEYIEKDAARDLMERALEDDWEIQYANDRLRDIPAADVVEVRHGRWIESPECPEEYDICSVCGLNDKHRIRGDANHPAFESIPPFCKWCGAKMDGGVNDAID